HLAHDGAQKVERLLLALVARHQIRLAPAAAATPVVGAFRRRAHVRVRLGQRRVVRVLLVLPRIVVELVTVAHGHAFPSPSRAGSPSLPVGVSLILPARAPGLPLSFTTSTLIAPLALFLSCRRACHSTPCCCKMPSTPLVNM